MIVQPRTQSFPTSLLTALCRQQTGNLLRYIYIYYGASILMHQIVQFLKLLTNLTIQKWTFSVHCVTGRKKDSSLWRKPPTVNCAESGLLPFPEDSTDTEEASSSPAPPAVSLEETPASAAGETFCASQPVNLPQEPQIRHYTLDEIAEFQKNPDIQEMLFVVETYIRHPFSENDINTILFWHEDLHFSAELIVYLVEYCVSKGHTNLRYLNKVALAWHEKKITSVEQAKSEAAVRSKAYYAVMKAFGITGRNLIDSETAMIRKWTKEYAFDLSLIQEACARTISSTGQSSFSYADSILTSWYNDKVHSLEDVKRLDATHQQKKKERAAVKANAAASPKKNNFNNFESRENDYKSLEAMLLNSPIRS